MTAVWGGIVSGAAPSEPRVAPLWRVGAGGYLSSEAAAGGDGILTEAGDTLVTEDGDRIVTEE